MQRYQNPNSCDISRPHCRYYEQGFCYRGASCKFPHPLKDKIEEASTRECPSIRQRNRHRHCNSPRSNAAIPIRRPVIKKVAVAKKDVSANAVAELCGICYEIPQLFGILTECEHVFCMICMLEWRKSFDTLAQIEQKRRCPICRAYSRFVIASDTFHPKGNDKTRMIYEWMQIMRRETCPMYRRCPDGLSCIFWHDPNDFIGPPEPEHKPEREQEQEDEEEEIWEVPQLLIIDDEITWESVA